MIFLFFGTSLALLEAELQHFKDWEEIWLLLNDPMMIMTIWMIFCLFLSPSLLYPNNGDDDDDEFLL